MKKFIFIWAERMVIRKTDGLNYLGILLSRRFSAILQIMDIRT